MAFNPAAASQHEIDAYLDSILERQKITELVIEYMKTEPLDEMSIDDLVLLQHALGVHPELIYSKEYERVRTYVNTHVKIWFVQPRQCWNAAITCLSDIQEFGTSPEECRANLTYRLWLDTEIRKRILSTL